MISCICSLDDLPSCWPLPQWWGRHFHFLGSFLTYKDKHITNAMLPFPHSDLGWIVLLLCGGSFLLEVQAETFPPQPMDFLARCTEPVSLPSVMSLSTPPLGLQYQNHSHYLVTWEQPQGAPIHGTGRFYHHLVGRWQVSWGGVPWSDLVTTWILGAILQGMASQAAKSDL